MHSLDCRTMFQSRYHTRRNVALHALHASTPNLEQAPNVRASVFLHLSCVYAFCSCRSFRSILVYIRAFCRSFRSIRVYFRAFFSSSLHDTTCASNHGHHTRFLMYQMYSYTTRHATHFSDHEEYPTIHLR